MPTAVPTPVPACCVEHQFSATGEVESTTCSGSRSPWDAATMTELCTAGYSEAGDVAPPFRDCRQEAIDSGNCEQNCAECDHNVGRYFANVGYASCPDWVVNAAYEEAENGGQCVEGLGGVHATSDQCIACRFCLDCETYGTCDLPVEEKCWGQGAYPACEALWQQCDWYYGNACREWGYPKEGEWNVDGDCCAGKMRGQETGGGREPGPSRRGTRSVRGAGGLCEVVSWNDGGGWFLFGF